MAPGPVLLVLLLLLAVDAAPPQPSGVRVGADVLVASGYKAVSGIRRLGIVANPTSVLPATLEHIVDRMHADGHANLVAVFGPEHGFRGDKQAGSGSATETDPQTNLTVYNTYGATHAELVATISLAGLDGLVFDIQDVGARYYTYIWTMFDMMCAAATIRDGFRFVVLDRPNPLGGTTVRGPMLHTGYTSGVGKVPIPVQHGKSPSARHPPFFVYPSAITLRPPVRPFLVSR